VNNSKAIGELLVLIQEYVPKAEVETAMTANCCLFCTVYQSSTNEIFSFAAGSPQASWDGVWLSSLNMPKPKPKLNSQLNIHGRAFSIDSKYLKLL
jgi:hypothetical protein